MVQKRLSIHGQSPLNRFFLSHLTLLFSIQSTFCERRLIILLKYFLQIYPPKIWWIQKSSTFAPAPQLHRGFHRTYSSFCRWLTLKYWRVKRKKAALGMREPPFNYEHTQHICVYYLYKMLFHFNEGISTCDIIKVDIICTCRNRNVAAATRSDKSTLTLIVLTFSKPQFPSSRHL